MSEIMLKVESIYELERSNTVFYHDPIPVKPVEMGGSEYVESKMHMFKITEIFIGRKQYEEIHDRINRYSQWINQGGGMSFRGIPVYFLDADDYLKVSAKVV